MECMAVQPQYQWVSEHKILQSNYCVITNVRADHLEEMGFSHNHIAKSLSNTIPINKKVFTSERESVAPIVNKAIDNNSEINICDGEHLDKKYLEGFPFIEHPDNIALALEVCHSIGVSRDDAIKGMKQVRPDPGALTVNKLKINDNNVQFVNAFAANDPQSTIQTISMIKDNYKNKKVGIFLNTRSDRQLRTTQLLDLIFSKIRPNHLIVRGDNLDDRISLESEKHSPIPLSLFNEEATHEQILDEISNLNGYLIIGIGNIVGWGELFMKKLREHNV